MKPHISILTLIAALLVTVSSAASADVFVIANSGTQIAGGDIKDVFTGEKQVAGSVKLVPVDNASVQEAFLSSALKMELTRYKSVWQKKGFREGLTAPEVKSGDSEVLDFVKKTPGGVGYVTSQPSGVTVVQKY